MYYSFYVVWSSATYVYLIQISIFESLVMNCQWSVLWFLVHLPIICIFYHYIKPVMQQPLILTISEKWCTNNLFVVIWCICACVDTFMQPLREPQPFDYRMLFLPVYSFDSCTACSWCVISNMFFGLLALLAFIFRPAHPLPAFLSVVVRVLISCDVMTISVIPYLVLLVLASYISNIYLRFNR